MSNITAPHGQRYAASSLFTYSDPFNSLAVEYDVWDTGTVGGHFFLNGAALSATQDNYITAAQLASLSYQSGSGVDTLWIRANDGTVWGAWSSAFTVNAPIDSGPVETVSNIVAPHGQSYAASELFPYRDPCTSPPVDYAAWDPGPAGAPFLTTSAALPANPDPHISTAQLRSPN